MSRAAQLFSGRKGLFALLLVFYVTSSAMAIEWSENSDGSVLSRSTSVGGDQLLPVNPETTLSPAGGVVGYWRFDDVTAGVAIDSSILGNNGTVENGAVSVPGLFGKALSFDGVNEKVEVPHVAEHSFTRKQSFSLSFWVKVTELPGKWVCVTSKSRNIAPWYGVWISADNRWVFGGRKTGSQWNYNIFGGKVTTGWHHVTITQNAGLGLREIYVNGISEGIGVSADANGIGPLVIGGAAGVNEFFRGIVDEVKLYSRALTEGEIVAMATMPTGDPDLNGDGVVDLQDLELMYMYMTENNPLGDLNYDGIVDEADLATLEAALQVQPPDSDNPGDPSGSDDGAPTPVVPVLVPGAGFTGPTAQPEAVGSPDAPGYDAMVIARWDVVPYQTFTGKFEIGVVAFHINGIDRVDFSVDGGEWVSVNAMSLNPRTGVYEYWVTLDAVKFAQDGPIEVRAIAYPKNAGLPRVLAGPIDGATDYKNGNHALFLNSNAGNTLPEPIVYVDGVNGSDESGEVGNPDKPFATAYKALAMIARHPDFQSADGAICYMQPGEYVWGRVAYDVSPKAETRWATITPAPGVARSQVVFSTDTAGGLRTRLIRAKNVTFSEEHTRMALKANPGNLVWIDGCRAIGSGPEVNNALYSGGTFFVYVTGTEISHFRSGIRSAYFYRDCYIHRISGSPFGDSACAIKCKIDDYTDPSNFHGDLFHWFGFTENRENYIAYNLDARNFGNAQGFFATYSANQSPGRMDNVAIVNVHITKDANNAAGTWWEKSTNHLLLWHVTMPDQYWRWNQSEGGNEVSNLSVIGCVFKAFQLDRVPTGGLRHNHFVDPSGYGCYMDGEDATSGDPGFVAPGSGDYNLKTDSPLRGRVPASGATPNSDINAKKRGLLSAVGSRCGPEE